MKQIEEIIEDQKKLSQERKNKREEVDSLVSSRSWQTGLLKYLLDKISKTLFKVELSNEKDLEPALRDIEKAVKSKEVVKEVTVKNLKDIVIPENKDTVKVSNLNEIQIPEVKIPSSVKVSNLNEIKFPEINIPEPKDVDLTVLVTELKALQTALMGKEALDTSKMEKSLSDVLSVLQKLLKRPEKEIVIPETDLLPVIEAAKETTEAIKSLSFPVPNFSSSWQHSLDMQSKDLAKTISYIGSTENIDYIQFTGVDGNTYRKTYNYDESGRNIGWTAWVKL